MPKKTENGYYVDIRPAGREGPRFRKTLPTRGEALSYEQYIVAQFPNREAWKKTTDPRSLKTLIDVWHKLHGNQLKTGNQRKSYLENLAEIMGNPRSDKITTQCFSKFRAKRFKEVSRNTVNHDLAYLKALFNELERLGEWHLSNPFAKIRKLKTDENELTYLDIEQIKILLEKLDSCEGSHAAITARICLATGARWSEAATLKESQIRAGMVHFYKTKNGRARSIPISISLQKLVKDNAPLTNGYNTFKRAAADLELGLPAGQLTHVLRHTFASHFMINGGNIIALQRILGHGNITMTMRYAHLAPDHLNEVLDLNPLQNAAII